MLEKKEIVIEGKTYVLHQFPASQGHDLYKRFKALNGDVDRQHDYMLRAMAFVGVKPDANRPDYEIMLDTEVMLNNHVPKVKMLLDLEREITAYNFDFLSQGEIFVCLNSEEKVADSMQSIETLTGLLDVLLNRDGQPSKSLKRSTRSKKHTTSGKV